MTDQFLAHIWSSLHYWERLPDKTTHERMEGLAFSILAMLDGESGSLPAFIVAPDPASGDKTYHQRRGENWYPRRTSDIAGGLHELFLGHPGRKE